MNLKQTLLECIPDAYYSDGRKSECMLFRIFNMFDIDSQSFKQVKEKKIMEDSSQKSDDYEFMSKFLAKEEELEKSNS